MEISDNNSKKVITTQSSLMEDEIEENDAAKEKELNPCTANGCAMKSNDLMLKCTECKHFTHFECTKLPAYQLFLYKTSKRRFICESCAGPVPDEFLERANQVNNFLNLKELIKSLQESLTAKSEESKSFLEKAREVKHQNTILKQKIKDMEDQQVLVTKKINEQDKYISGYRSPKKTMEKDLLKSIEDLLETKLVDIEERLKQSVLNELENNKKAIGDKLDTVINDNKSYAESVKGNLNDSEAASSGVTSFKLILEDARNDQLIEEKEKEKRANNFIIHGLEEKGDNTDTIQNNDTVMIELFFKKINIQARPTKFYRLGKSENKKRPLKIEMSNIVEKDSVMKNLNLLKGTEEELGKLSVKDDFTKTEREQVRKFVNIAKERNTNDSSNYWVVRGTPKNGLSLVKLTRR